MSVIDRDIAKRLQEIYDRERRIREKAGKRKSRLWVDGLEEKNPLFVELFYRLAHAVSRLFQTARFRATEWFAHYTGW